MRYGGGGGPVYGKFRKYIFLPALPQAGLSAKKSISKEM